MSPNDALPVASQLCLALMRVGTRMSARFDVRFAPHDLTQAQFRALLGVWQMGQGDGAVTPSALADFLLIERPTATALVAKLVNRGLLVRVPAPGDRRSHTLHLTQSGGELLQSAGEAATRLGEKTTASFGEAEQVMFLQLLTRMEEHLRRIDDETSGLSEVRDG
ncbi:MAG: MarR family transcriptional regulator [Armatimonadetes bacterium]|nr:MarR family transcriptional regulator [Armatimonadota bacterium]